MARDPVSPAWSGRVVERARTIVAQWLPAICQRCGQPVTLDDDWVVGHIKSRHAYPELTMDLTNWQAEHKACSNRSSNEAIAEKVRREIFGDDFSAGTDPRRDPALPVSLPGDHGPAYQPALPISLPFGTNDAPTPTRDDLTWSVQTLAQYAWLEDLLDVPDDASVPLWMSPPPDDAIGSYGADAIAWIEQEQKITLRWWQRLAIVRQLEYRADGTLCARTMVESAPRRAGKSVRMRGLALWRLAHADLFTETQLVMHTGSDMAICREIQRGAWRWAQDVAGWDVTQGNGKEAIETGAGDRWLVRSQVGVYGYDVTLGLVDEAWDVAPETVTEGMEPATLERVSPQLHLTSTAHRRSTSLMRGRISAALAAHDPEVILLLWGAPADADAADPAVWRAASPHWTEDRRKMIASKYQAALDGQADPQADDPDPIASFTSQYLNIWRLKDRRVDRGRPIVTPEAWAALAALAPDQTPSSAAIESWFSAGVTVVLVRMVGTTAVATTTSHDTVEDAAEVVTRSGFRGRVAVGASLAQHPAIRLMPHREHTASVSSAVRTLTALLRESVVRHDGSTHLAGQITGVRTMPGAEGLRVVSTGRGDALKALAWAVTDARPAARSATRGRLKIMTARE